MNESLEFLVRHGAAVLFAAVFIEQMGVPLPAAPWLLAAGALAGAGTINWFVTLTVAVVGLVLADLIWVSLGRHGGQRVLSLLCRISDLRSHVDLEQNPPLIRGALHMTMDEMQVRQHEIPRDRDIVLYCSCPNEVSSAKAAWLLHRKGILRVRPFAGRD
jgi:hypothetical protein